MVLVRGSLDQTTDVVGAGGSKVSEETGLCVVSRMKFQEMSDEELRRIGRSVEVIDYRLFNDEDMPVIGGLHDLRMGSVLGMRCATCGRVAGRCEGHWGRIEFPEGVALRDPLSGKMRNVMLVSPNGMRKVRIMDEVLCVDDATVILCMLVKANQWLKDIVRSEAPEVVVEDVKATVQKYWDGYVGMTSGGKGECDGELVGRGGKKMDSVVDRLMGKGGVVRGEVCGKQTQSSARIVTIGDPSLGIDEVRVPKWICDHLSVPESVESFVARNGNVEDVLYTKMPNGRVYRGWRDGAKSEGLSGVIVERKLRNGDVVMHGRQPSLHVHSMVGLKVVTPETYGKRWEDEAPGCRGVSCAVAWGKVIAVNPVVCAGENLDFDGDETTIYVCRSPEVIEEVWEKMRPSVWLERGSKRDGSVIVKLQQDFKLWAYLNSVDSEPKTEEELNVILKGGRSLRRTFDRETMELMMKAKSKGNMSNVVQMWGADPKGLTGGPTGGSSLVKGLTATGGSRGEFWTHASQGRQSLVHKGISVRVSGYVQRRLVNSLADLRVCWNEKGFREVREETTGEVVLTPYEGREEVGSWVGVVVAQSLGEPATQMTLRSFHRPGEIDVSPFKRLEKLLMSPGSSGAAGDEGPKTEEEHVRMLKSVYEDSGLSVDEWHLKVVVGMMWLRAEEGVPKGCVREGVMKGKSVMSRLAFEGVKKVLREMASPEGREDDLKSPIVRAMVGLPIA